MASRRRERVTSGAGPGGRSRLAAGCEGPRDGHSAMSIYGVFQSFQCTLERNVVGSRLNMSPVVPGWPRGPVAPDLCQEERPAGPGQ